MKEVFLLSEDEKRELKSIADIMLSVTHSFEMFTSDEIDEDGDENEYRLGSIEELRNRMKYDMEHLEKAYTIITKILYGTYDGMPSVKNYELGQ